MKVAYVYLNTLKTGQANAGQVLRMVKALGRVAEVTFLASWVSESTLRKVSQFYGVEGCSARISRLPVALASQPFWLEKMTRTFYAVLVVSYLRLSSDEVVYTRDFGFIYFLSLLPRWMRPRQPILYEPHTIYHRSSPSKVTFSQEKRALQTVKYFLPISNGIAEDLRKYFGVQNKMITVLPDGVDLQALTEAKGSRRSILQRYGIATEVPLIVYTGSFLNWKGVDVLVQSVKHLQNLSSKIFILGGQGADYERVFRLVRQEKLEDRITLAKPRPFNEVLNILKSSDIAVIPNTNTEIGGKYTSPLKLFEYMGCGLPIVASDLPAMREVITTGKNGYFFRPDDARDLARCLDLLLSQSELRIVMGNNNHEKAKKFSWSTRAQHIQRVADHVLNTH